MTEIEIYTKDWCGYCNAAKRLLQQLGYSFHEVDVTNDQELYQAMLNKSEGRTTVPQIFINGTGIGGYTDLNRLANANQLPPPG